MNDRRVTLTTLALTEYAGEKGRAAFLMVEAEETRWEGGIAEDEARPAASLLKLPLAMAAESAMLSGHLDPSETVPVNRLVRSGESPSLLERLDPEHRLAARELLGLAICASDNPSARWLLEAVGLPAVTSVLEGIGCRRTGIEKTHGVAGWPLKGTTTCRDALIMLRAADDPAAFPLTSAALKRSIRNSRIPLGATGDDVRIAHKTGSLPGVAHDVAHLDCLRGGLWAAFLTERQHDTLVSGYAMGLCTRKVLEAWGLAVRGTQSAEEGEEWTPDRV